MDTKKAGIAALAAVGGVATVLLGIQLIPYGHDHSNPPVAAEVTWDAPATHDLAARACLDCHSNETKWPWYSNIAPVSWVVSRHIDEGREVLNLSEMNRTYEEAGEAAEVVEEGEMPPAYYTLLHPEARLSPAETAQLVAGLKATLGTDAGEAAERGEE